MSASMSLMGRNSAYQSTSPSQPHIAEESAAFGAVTLQPLEIRWICWPTALFLSDQPLNREALGGPVFHRAPEEARHASRKHV